jgi:protein-tyrosine-phosphatase
MAEGILRTLGGDRVEAASAGTEATRVHPLAIATMAVRGIDIRGQRSKRVDGLAGRRFDVVVTVCDNARESCPFFPGATEQLHWSIPDPAAVEGDDEDQARAFEAAAQALTTRISSLLRDAERRATP